jgi:hypothetical protein
MTSAAISATEDFRRHQCGLAVEEHPAHGSADADPSSRRCFTETASHFGAEKLKRSTKATDGNRSWRASPSRYCAQGALPKWLG